MKYYPLAILILTLSLLSPGQSTRLTFYVDHKVEQPLDYVEINAVVKASGESLDQSI